MGEGHTGEPQANQERLTVAQAATRLGITEGAVRSRIKRGTLSTSKEGRTVYVLWGGGTSQANQPTNTGAPYDQSTLIETLRDQIEDLRRERDEWREQARITDRLLSAAMERIPAIEAPQEASEDAETVEEAPERAEPRPATGGTQEGTERPQQRSGWLAPVNRLPWWHYVLGLSFTLLAAYIGGYVSNSSIFIRIWGSMHDLFAISLPIILAGIWAPPGVFGFWIGLRLQNPRVWSRIIPLGALVGVASVLGAYCGFRGFLMLRDSTIDIPIGEFVFAGGFIGLPSWLLFVSASLIGNAWQRRRTGRVSGTTPVSPASRAAQGAAQQPRKDLTPAQQAILGWGGAIISALITFVGTIFLG